MKFPSADGLHSRGITFKHFRHAMLMPMAVVVVVRPVIQDLSEKWEILDCVRESYRRNNGNGNCIDISISLLDKAFYLRQERTDVLVGCQIEWYLLVISIKDI